MTAARVLVVDDDVRIAASVRRSLSYEGHEVFVAHDGPGGLEGGALARTGPVRSVWSPSYPAFWNTAAAPMPPPMHMLTIPYSTSRRLISCSSVAVSLAPVQPRG